MYIFLSPHAGITTSGVNVLSAAVLNSQPCLQCCAFVGGSTPLNVGRARRMQATFWSVSNHYA